MMLKIAIVFCLLATACAGEEKKRKPKRNLEYLSHHPQGYRLERRIAIGPNRYPSFFPQRTTYRRPQSVPAPPYAVPMEPLMQYSQRDPLYDPNLANQSLGNDLQTDNNRLSENIYGKHVIERPVYIKEPEPIIEIIIKESNVTLPPPVQPIPTPKKKEQVQVFYVKYKKNPGGKGKDSIIYEKPIPALTPHVKDEEEVVHKPEVLPELVTSAPPPSTTLRAIIKPESETFHAHKGIHITFGQEHKQEHDDANEESAPEPIVSLPQEHRSFRTERQRVPQPYAFEEGPQFGKRIQFQGNPNLRHPQNLPVSQNSNTHINFRPQTNFNPPPPQHQQVPQHQIPQHQVPQHQVQQHQVPQHQVQQHQGPQHQGPQHQGPQHQGPQHQGPQHQVLQHQVSHQQVSQIPASHQIPRTPPFSQQLPAPLAHNRPTFQNYNYFKQQSQVIIPPTNFRQPVPYQPFEQVKVSKPHSHFPIRPPQPQPAVNFNQNFPPPPISQFENGFAQQLPVPQNQVSFNQQLGEQPKNQKLEFGPQFGQQFGPETPPTGVEGFQRSPDQQNKLQEEEFRRQQEFKRQQEIQNQQFREQQQLQHQQNEANKNLNQIPPGRIIPPGGELIQSVPKYEQHYEVQANGQSQKIQFASQQQPQSLPLQSVPLQHQNYQNQDLYRQKIQREQFRQSQQEANNKPKSTPDVDTRQNEQFLRQFQQQHQQLTQIAQRQKNEFDSGSASQQSFAEQQFQELLANHPRGPSFLDANPSTTQRIRYASTTPAPKTPTTTQPTTTTKDPKELNLQLPDEVPEDLRQQLLSSGILNNAQISVLDYDKVGDIPLSALPPDQLANFYGAGGAAQLASGSAPVPSVAKPDQDQEVEASENEEVKVLPKVEMKVVRYDPQTEEGKQVPKKYIKDDAKTTEPVELNESYNRYLPLKVSGAQFPIPDIPELKGKKISSVVVLAPVDYEFEKPRVTREATLEGLKFPKQSALKRLLDDPSKDNYIQFLETENKTSPNQQSVILLVTEPTDSDKEKEIFMYDVATQTVSKLSGELSSAFVDAAEANSNDSTAAASNLVEVRIPSPENIDRSDDFEALELDGKSSEIVSSKIPIIDPMDELEPEASENFEKFVDVSGQELSVSGETVQIESGYSKTNKNKFP